MRSAATASRRVAVKSSAAGSPHSSPITADRAGHLSPSSIAHSASLASRASTWMRFWLGRPGGWIRPLSRIAMRSWTHSTGLVGRDLRQQEPRPAAVARMRREQLGQGRHPPLHLQGRGTMRSMVEGSFCGKAPPSRLRRATSPAKAGEETLGRTETAPPATRDRPLATRLTTLMFCFCSYRVSRPAESILRLGTKAKLFQKQLNFADNVARRALRDAERHMRAAHLDRLVALVLQPACGARGDDPVPPRP